MIICIDHYRHILWTHQDNGIKEQKLWSSDPNVILIEKELVFPDIPRDDFIYVHKWNSEIQDVVLEQIGVRVRTDRELLEGTDNKTTQIIDDNMINMELGLETNEKVALSQEDGLVIMELLLDIQSKLTTP